MIPPSGHGFLRATLLVLLCTVSGISHAQITLSFSSFEPAGTSAAGSTSIEGVIGQPEGSVQSQDGFDRIMHGAALPGDVPPADPTSLDFIVEDMGDNSAPRLTWTTSSEPNILGFDIYRAVDAGGSYTTGDRLTPSPVAPTGTPSTGDNYEFFDPAVFAHGGGGRAYLLAVIDTLGSLTFFGEVLLADPGITSVPDWQTLND